jgi:hypothetical protein
MSGGTDPDPDSAEVTYLGLSKRSLILEVVRASYAVGIGAVVTTIPVLGVYVLGIELPDVVVFTGFLVGLGVLPAGLYFYDRYHERDLVIADLGQAVFRLVAYLNPLPPG